LKRADFEREWGTSYQKPGFGARFLAVLLRLMPKVGPFKALKFQMPSPATETLYLQSVNATVEQYRGYLKELGAGTLVLTNTDFDTAKPTRAGEYRLTDEAYARLLGKLADAHFTDLPPALRQNLLDFYENPEAVIATGRKIAKWNRTLKNIQQLKSTSAETPAGHP
jgi:hypothetical protein